MHTFISPIRTVKAHMARRRQLRTAFTMLSASGVLRPGHVELRYASPITRKGLSTPHSAGGRSMVHSPNLDSVNYFRAGLTKIKQWVGTYGPIHPLTEE